jgi:hypothetical protein
MRDIRRTIGTAPVQKQAATASITGQMLAQCPDSLIGHRECAAAARRRWSADRARQRP